MTEQWRSIIWRAVRGFVATIVAIIGASIVTAVTDINIITIDLSTKEKALQTLAIPLITGFLLALGKGLRDKYGNDNRAKGLLNKLFI